MISLRQPLPASDMKNKIILVFGDLLALLIVTVIGFASHGETSLSALPRIPTTFLPLTAAWFLTAPWLGLFRPQVTHNPRLLWRPLLAMLLAAPTAATLRGFMLNVPVLPLFALILGGSAALIMTVWRAIFWLLRRGT